MSTPTTTHDVRPAKCPECSIPGFCYIVGRCHNRGDSLSDRAVAECIDRYWRERMSHRQSKEDEVERLVTTLWGWFVRTAEKGWTIGMFFTSKRPYGNKNVPASIAFNLGWDRDRVGHIPEWVETEAMEIHRLVGEEIAKDTNYAPQKRLRGTWTGEDKDK